MLLLYYYSDSLYLLLFFFNYTPTTEIYTLSLHDALPIWKACPDHAAVGCTTISTPSATAIASTPMLTTFWPGYVTGRCGIHIGRSEEHTSELQSRGHLVCRLLLEKKKKKTTRISTPA